MERPTCEEIASNFDLWGEYVDPDATMTEQEFEEMSIEEGLGIIHALFPEDCNCS